MFYTDHPGQFAAGTVLGIEGERRALTIQAIRPNKGAHLVAFEELPDRTAAEDLRGTRLTLDRARRRTLDADEFWPDDLAGAQVKDPSGSTLGRVVDVEVGGSQDRLIVETADGRRVEVPFVGALVPEVDVEAGVVVVEPVRGLFD